MPLFRDSTFRRKTPQRNNGWPIRLADAMVRRNTPELNNLLPIDIFAESTGLTQNRAKKLIFIYVYKSLFLNNSENVQVIKILVHIL